MQFVIWYIISWVAQATTTNGIFTILRVFFEFVHDQLGGFNDFLLSPLFEEDFQITKKTDGVETTNYIVRISGALRIFAILTSFQCETTAWMSQEVSKSFVSITPLYSIYK